MPKTIPETIFTLIFDFGHNLFGFDPKNMAFVINILNLVVGIVFYL
jgi:hypothetical protein